MFRFIFVFKFGVPDEFRRDRKPEYGSGLPFRSKGSLPDSHFEDKGSLLDSHFEDKGSLPDSHFEGNKYQLEPLEHYWLGSLEWYRLGSLEWYRLGSLGGMVSVGTFGRNDMGPLGEMSMASWMLPEWNFKGLQVPGPKRKFK
ncbi:unnamed protein product [Rhizophagus irregularis]|nr:unnamed protein product [Rhizophagus irregularis]